MEDTGDAVVIQISTSADHLALHRILVVSLDLAQIRCRTGPQQRLLVNLGSWEGKLQVEVSATCSTAGLVAGITLRGQTRVVCLARFPNPPCRALQAQVHLAMLALVVDCESPVLQPNLSSIFLLQLAVLGHWPAKAMNCTSDLGAGSVAVRHRHSVRLDGRVTVRSSEVLARNVNRGIHAKLIVLDVRFAVCDPLCMAGNPSD